MRYFQSWLFDASLILILSGVASIYVTTGETQVVSGPQDMIQAGYTDYDMRLPLGLTVLGLATAAIAITRAKATDARPR